jgi:hypothetical protein
MPPNQLPQNLGLALAQMNQGSVSPFGNSQVNPQQLHAMQQPVQGGYSYQPQQSQMSQMQLSPTQQAMYMPQQQQQQNPFGQAMGNFAQSLKSINQENENNPYSQYQQPLDYGNVMQSTQGIDSNKYAPGMFGY